MSDRRSAHSMSPRRSASHNLRAGRDSQKRRGVSSVLAMMFMVVFSSLAAVMAVVAQGNMRTAASGLQLSRAMSAAETGLAFAARRLQEQSARFVVEKGVISETYASDLWHGTFDEGADGDVEILPPTDFIESTPPSGLAEAIRNAHVADLHSFTPEPGDSALPEIDPTFGTLRVRPIRLSQDVNTPYFRLRYEILADDPFIRVTSQGVDGAITRTLQLDFRLNKRIEFAILSPSRIMIGKNVRVEGPLGSLFGIEAGELDGAHSHPLVMRSDFYHLDTALDTKLDILHNAIEQYDTDGDGRLRPDHATEALGLGDPTLVDYDGDEFVTDFDLFLAHYDVNADRIVVYDEALATAAGLASVTVEFDDIDDQLARLIDEAFPDRDGDGEITASDTMLGYRDGAIDINDIYAKVHGRLSFAVTRPAWEAALSLTTYQEEVHGPVRYQADEAPVTFAVAPEDMHAIETDMVDEGQSWFSTAAAGTPFGWDPADPGATAGQVAAGVGAGGTFTPPGPTTWEPVPFGSAGAYDFYKRPVFEDMTFNNVRIPTGTNALFVNCTFIGVTFIETETDTVHENWNYVGAVEPIGPTPTYQLKFPTLVADHGGTPISADPGSVDGFTDGTKSLSNNIRFDNCTFLGSISGDKPTQYTHWRNKIQLTGETRFYIDPNDPDLLAEIAAGTPQAPDWQTALLGIDADARFEMAKSSILLPGWSVDVGNFNNEVDADPTLTPKVKLKGTIVAGILDVRGTADVHGTLLMTYRPVEAQGPLHYGGLPDAFNTTIGYFGPSDGDGEGVDPDDASFEGFGEITLRYNPDALLPDGIPWPLTTESQPLTYVEGGSL